MIESNKVEEGNFNQFENVLRPKGFAEYVGQSRIKDALKISIEAAKRRGDFTDHVLFHGAPGLGKTTLAAIMANETGSSLKITSGPALERPGDLASILSNVSEGDILFIDEIHRLKPATEEVLYTAMEDFGIDIVIGKGPAARSMRLEMAKFTLIGATTKINQISAPLRSRFGNVYKLDFYTDSEISKVLLRSASLLGVNLPENLALELAKSCRQTPRIANRLLKHVRDYASVKNSGVIDAAILNEALSALGIDEKGLEQVDREIIDLIISKFGGGPVGLNTIAAALSEESAVIENIYEPFLLKMGMLDRTSRGRIATRQAYDHMGIKYQN